MRKFNTSGPNILAQHYTLSRLELIEKGKELVHTNRYFTIQTTRETGKSTYFRLLGNALQEDGYLVCHINFGNYFNNPLSTFMERLVLGLNRGIYLVFVDKQVTNPYILEGTEVIEGVDLITYIVRYDLDVDFSEPRKAKLPPKKKGLPKQKKKA
jgi:hypothetical protein